MSTRTLTTIAVALALILATAGCSEGTTVKYSEVVADTDTTAKDVPAAPEETIEFLSLDQGGFEFVPQEGGFRWPCTGNEQCDSGFCVVTTKGRVCTMNCLEDCPDGWRCIEVDTKPDIAYLCVERFTTLCDPCTTNLDCKHEEMETTFADQCLEFPGGAGSFCGADCSGDQGACPTGYQCQSVSTPEGDFQQCLPEDGQCSCSFAAKLEQKTTECFQESEQGKCLGERMCTQDGLTDCGAAVPGAEICDDIDNDCNLTVDEGCDDDADGFCDADMTTVGNPAACGSGGGDCNDGDPTIYPGATELCDLKDNDCDGELDGPLCCGKDTDCNDDNPCTTDTCNMDDSTCIFTPSNSSCDDGNLCTMNDTCLNGVCTGGSEQNCDDGEPCTQDSCHATQGCLHEVAEGLPCIAFEIAICEISGVCGTGGCSPTPMQECTCEAGCILCVCCPPFTFVSICVDNFFKQ